MVVSLGPGGDVSLPIFSKSQSTLHFRREHGRAEEEVVEYLACVESQKEAFTEHQTCAKQALICAWAPISLSGHSGPCKDY